MRPLDARRLRRRPGLGHVRQGLQPAARLLRQDLHGRLLDLPGRVGVGRVEGRTGGVTKHGKHACDRELVYCPHRCNSSCSVGHECPPCASTKVAVCEHGSKPSACSSLSEPCKAECSWACAHQGACSLPCGSVRPLLPPRLLPSRPPSIADASSSSLLQPCDRLPCDVPCDKTLKCGCPCLSRATRPPAVVAPCPSSSFRSLTPPLSAPFD